MRRIIDISNSRMITFDIYQERIIYIFFSVHSRETKYWHLMVVWAAINNMRRIIDSANSGIKV